MFFLAGKLSEAERDNIEAQVAEFLQTCKQNIVRLQSSIEAERASLSADAVAHRLGVVSLRIKPCPTTSLPAQHCCFQLDFVACFTVSLAALLECLAELGIPS